MNKLNNKNVIFLRKARSVHGDKYDYSMVEYVNAHVKVKIVCSKHGVFEQTPSAHIHGGQGCPKCGCEQIGMKLVSTKERFIASAKKVHGDKYDYSKVVYENNQSKVVITCPEHGDFCQQPNNHLHGNGCPTCAKKRRGLLRRNSVEYFLSRAKEVHGDKYDYSLVDYVRSTDVVKIICPKHGVFEQTPHKHMLKRGCPTCGRERIREAVRAKMLTNKTFARRASKVHSGKYDYSLVQYKGWDVKVSIICPTHGVFKQQPGSHLSGCGCSRCATPISKSEVELFEFCNSEVECVQSNRKVLHGKELDVYVPSLNLGFEYNGLYYHSDVFRDDRCHLDKLELCNSKGVRLIQIFEDEWKYKNDICKSRILNLLGKTPVRIFARKCEIRYVPSSEASSFLNENHIQGNINAKIRLGLYFQEELVSLMTFGSLRKSLGQTTRSGAYEMLRFCNKINTNVVGGASKLLKYFEGIYNPSEVVSYADRRWSEGALYKQLGFKHVHNSKPNYFYVRHGIREHRFSYRKSVLVEQGFDANKTEREIMSERGYFRIYDCGSMKFVKTF